MSPLLLIMASLALIQGIAEFLPVSSSGHLVLFQHIELVRTQLETMGSDTELFLSVLLHLATLLAVIIFLRKDLRDLVTGAFSGIRNGDWSNREIRTGLYILVASLPAAVIGILLHDFFERMFSSVTSVLILLILNGVILIMTKIIPLKCREIEEMGVFRSLAVGCFQACAILPGISRSGSTIAGGMMAGLVPEESAKFSFLMAIPVIAGAGFLEMMKLGQRSISPEVSLYLGISMMLALLIGLASLKLLFSLVKRVRIDLFGYYTIALGISGLIVRLMTE